MDTLDPATAPDGSRVTFTGTITGIKPRSTRQDNPWAEITVTRGGDLLTCDILPADYRDLTDPLVLDSVVTATGTVGDYGDYRKIRITALHTDALPTPGQSAEEFLTQNHLTEVWRQPAPTAQDFVAHHDATPFTSADYDTQLNLLAGAGTEA